MSETSSPHRGLTRRGFLKASGVAAGALGLAGAASMTTFDGWLAPAKAYAEPEERVAHLCHQFHCLTGCNLKCTIRDERVALIEPSDLVDETHRTICLRGINEVAHIYSQDRLQTPLRRVGERGEGKFEQISWDEAIKAVADAIKESQQKYGENSVFVRKSTEASIGFDFIGPLLRADQGGEWGLDRGQPNGQTPAFGAFSYCPSRSIWEFSDASTIIEVGHNPLESGIVWSRALMDAKEAGVYIAVLDPRFSGTASKADLWLPVRPGTDAAVIQGMIRAIVDEQWYDEEFVKANTSLPFLIDKKTGKNYVRRRLRELEWVKSPNPIDRRHYAVLRNGMVDTCGSVRQGVDKLDDELCPNPTVVTAEDTGKPYVWDEVTNAPALYDAEGVKPALEGSWTVDGKELVTEFFLMKKWISEYSLEWASETSGIEQDVIVDLADRYANNGPAIIDYGLGGPDKYTNADVLGHSMSILTALTGNYGRKGSGFGFYGGVGADDPAATLNYWTLPEENAARNEACSTPWCTTRTTSTWR